MKQGRKPKKQEVKKMFVVFDMQGAEYCKTWNEVEADTIAAQIGGYYVESEAYWNCTKNL